MRGAPRRRKSEKVPTATLRREAHPDNVEEWPRLADGENPSPRLRREVPAAKGGECAA
jgi:hypothetical protein